MNHPRALALAALALGFAPAAAAADGPLDATGVLEPQGARLESLRLRFTHYEQEGRGFQSQAYPEGQIAQKGSEWLQVEQPQLEAVVRWSPRLRTRIWIPVDVVTAASPDAIDRNRSLDAMSSASRITEGGNLDATTTWQADRRTRASVRFGFRLEENFRSWNAGAGVERSFADDNTTIAVSVNQVVDWFDTYRIDGVRDIRAWRSSSNANLGLTQLLSPSTVAALSYGVTLQLRHLGNTWNSVPLDDGTRGPEVLPEQRQRHAIAGRIAQGLPWWGALKASYRFYVDDWGILANTAEAQLYQRLSRAIYLRGSYRFHHQSGASFFQRRAATDPALLRTADSDLDTFFAHTFGGRIVADWRTGGRILRGVELYAGYEYYWRSNDLQVHIASCGTGFRF